MTRLGSALLLFSVLPCAVACGEHDYVIGRFTDEQCNEHSSALVCSGFEKPDLSDWSNVIVVKDASVEQSDARAYRGKGALHAGSTGDKSAAVVAREFTPVEEGDLYLRAHLYVPAELPTETMNVVFLGDYATPDPFKGVDFNLENGGAVSIYSPGNNPDRVTNDAFTIPRDEWFCFRIHLVVSADAGSVVVNVNDDVALDHQGMKTNTGGGVHLLRAGVDWSSLQTAPFDFYIDDLVLDTEPVACDD